MRLAPGFMLVLCLLSAAAQPEKSQRRTPATTPPQSEPACAGTREDLQKELDETKALINTMAGRIPAMRNAAGTVSDFEVRTALQVNADMWQQLVDNLKVRVSRMQDTLDRCEARARIRANQGPR